MEDMKNKISQQDQFGCPLTSLPSGWKFIPSDEEIVSAYLKPKVEDHPLPPNLIYHIDIRELDPQTLAGKYEPQGGEKWYFFTPRYKRYPKGGKPTRTVKNGFWKATGKDTKVKNKSGQVIGKKTTLVFYQGPSNKEGQKTDWIMQEYVLISIQNSTLEECTTLDPHLLDRWVLCKIYTHEPRKSSPSLETWLETQIEEAEKEEKTDNMDGADQLTQHVIPKTDNTITSQVQFDRAYDDKELTQHVMSTSPVANDTIYSQAQLDKAVLYEMVPSHGTLMTFSTRDWDDTIDYSISHQRRLDMPTGATMVQDSHSSLDHISGDSSTSMTGASESTNLLYPLEVDDGTDIVAPCSPCAFDWLQDDSPLSNLLYPPSEETQPSKWEIESYFNYGGEMLYTPIETRPSKRHKF